MRAAIRSRSVVVGDVNSSVSEMIAASSNPAIDGSGISPAST
ncbi:MAG: hypothetical protein U0841_12925 [Chloroflexia bacterium]